MDAGKTKIKICGLRSGDDIAIVNETLPDYAGFVVDFPKSFRSNTPEQVERLVSGLDARILPVGVFVDEDEETVVSLLRDGVIAMAQLHGSEDDAYVRRIREKTGKPVIKAWIISSPEDLVQACASSADYVLLDAGKGEGKAFDWSYLENGLERPFFLAGGLTPESIAEAVRRCRPFAVDISSGVETARKKDAQKVRQAVMAARRV